MKNVFPFLVILLLASTNLFAIENWNKIQLAENEHVTLILHYFENADLGDKDWLKIELKNKTDQSIYVKRINYHIDRPLDGQSNYGNFGQGGKHDLIPFYYDQKIDQSCRRKEAEIEANSSIFGWKYLTNYASVLIDGRKNMPQNICGSFNVDFEYILEDKKHEINCEQKQFCFDWTQSDKIKKEKLVTRLREVVVNAHYRWVDSYIITNLMERPEILKEISTEELIKGVLIREESMTYSQAVLFLKELKNRNEIPNKQLTEYYRKRIRANEWQVKEELPFYWDPDLAYNLCFSEMPLSDIQHIFEMNSEYLKNDTGIANQFYKFLKNRQSSQPPVADSMQMANWSANIKGQAISRSKDFIKEIKPFLEEESEFEIAVFSNKILRAGFSLQPDTVKVRVCDVAFVALLRALDQIDFQPNFDFKQKPPILVIKNDILEKEFVSSLRKEIRSDHSMYEFEHYIKLTPERKKKALAMIAAIK